MGKRRRYLVKSFPKLSKTAPSNFKLKLLFKSTLNFIKNYSPIFGGFTLFLGGLHQIIALFSIGPGYVRFFSVTQLLSDGIISLIIIATYLLCLAIYYFVIFPFLESRYSLKENEDKISHDMYVYTVYMFLIFLVIFLQIDLRVNDFKEIFEWSYPQVYYLEVPAIIIRLTFLLVFIGSIGYWVNWRPYFKNLFKGMVIFLGFLIFVQITTTTFKRGLKIFIPEDLNNLSILNCYKLDGVKEPKVRYFNDKYIFLEEEPSNRIRVINLNKFLEVEPCLINEGK